MNHLRKYNEELYKGNHNWIFDYKDTEISLDLKDICLELSDEGFDIEVALGRNKNKDRRDNPIMRGYKDANIDDGYQVRITKRNENENDYYHFNIIKCREVILRMIDYMNEYNYEVRAWDPDEGYDGTWIDVTNNFHRNRIIKFLSTAGGAKCSFSDMIEITFIKK